MGNLRFPLTVTYHGCPDGNSTALRAEVTGRNLRQYENHRASFELSPSGPGSSSCSLSPTTFNPADIDVRPGESGYFDIVLTADGSVQSYQFHDVYDPWYWFRKHWPALIGISLALSALSVFTILFYVKPLWNLNIYRALKLSQIDKLSIPGLGPPLQLALKVFTVLPFFITRPRTLDAWVNAHMRKVGQDWDLNTQPENEQDGLQASSQYIPLPIRVETQTLARLSKNPTRITSARCSPTGGRWLRSLVPAEPVRQHWLDKLEDGPLKVDAPAAFLDTPGCRCGSMRS